ncbi:uncharacterized protein [Aegilops tauschii subsp. strangulata]|uniref:uncharacterized protein isoform X3 n=1 Tax=Aegilops tauschii subsp. strangulata TaxID=200361 RepID=UPI003CC84341
MTAAPSSRPAASPVPPPRRLARPTAPPVPLAVAMADDRGAARTVRLASPPPHRPPSSSRSLLWVARHRAPGQLCTGRLPPPPPHRDRAGGAQEGHGSPPSSSPSGPGRRMSALPRDRLNGRRDAAVAADEDIAGERGGSHRRPRACGRVGERGGSRDRGRARALAQQRVVEHGGGPTMAELEHLSLRWLLRVPLLGEVLKSHCLFRSSRIRPSCRLLLRRDVARLRNNLPPPPRFISGEALWNPWCCPSRTMVAGLWGIRMDIEKSGSSGWQVLWPRSSSTHPHFRLLTWQLFTEVCCFGLAGMCASMVGPCGLLARMEKHRKVSPLHRLYYSHASYLAMSFCSHRCVHNNSDSAMPDTVSLNKDSFGGLFYHQFPGAKSPNGSALLQSSLEARAVT